jgi:methylated-DNA-[protein]-cysteine S-methyltransferase
VQPLYQVSSATPLGNLRVIADGKTLVAAGFTNFAALRAKLSPEDRGRKLVSTKDSLWINDVIADYFDGDINAFDGLLVRQPGSNFSQSAWQALRKIPGGKVISYATLAKKAGSAAAVRAAGTACGRNAIAPFIPCHRIIRSDGAIGNYGYGSAKKIWLLRHEKAID